MEYTEFEAKALAALEEHHNWSDDERTRKEGIYVRWDTGGQTGGSYHGTDRYERTEGEPEPEFEDLDVVLEAICPTISFLAYKGILRDVVVSTSGGGTPDYYGNFTYWAEKRCRLQNLHAHLEKRGLLPS